MSRDGSVGIGLPRRVLLIGWSGADWKIIQPLLESGAMPALAGLVNRGVMGEIATPAPLVSPILWTSIATGKRGDQHGILSDAEFDPVAGLRRPIGVTARTCQAVWNILSHAGLITHQVGWVASHPAEVLTGVSVSDHFATVTALYGHDWPVYPQSVAPEELISELGEFRVHPQELDEAVIRSFVPQAHRIDQRTDQRLAKLARFLSAATTMHAVATWVLESRPWDFLSVCYDMIGQISRRFMAYFPPHRDGIDILDYEVYQHVVTATYLFQDMLLARLLQLAGSDATVIVVSEHGFHSDHRRPLDRGRVEFAPMSAWYRPHGFLAMAGPGIRADELIHGANLLDVTPTILTLLGLPVGADMEGRALTGALVHPPDVRFIPSWETEVPARRLARDMQGPPSEDVDEALAVLDSLGVTEPESLRRSAAANWAERDQARNLAVVQFDARRFDVAADQFAQLFAQQPNDVLCLTYLVQCYLRLQRWDECQKLLTTAAIDDDFTLDLLRAELALAEGQASVALEHVDRVAQQTFGWPDVYCEIGDLYLRLSQWKKSLASFEQALVIDRHSLRGLFGVARAYFLMRNYHAANEAAIAVIANSQTFAQGHYLLGLATMALRQAERSRQAFETVLKLQPQSWEAHCRLAELHQHAFHNPSTADEHLRRAAELEREYRLSQAKTG